VRNGASSLRGEGCNYEEYTFSTRRKKNTKRRVTLNNASDGLLESHNRLYRTLSPNPPLVRYRYSPIARYHDALLSITAKRTRDDYRKDDCLSVSDVL